MKRLVLGTLIALAATQAAGCIIVSDDTTEYAHVSATWDIKSISTGQSLACPTGYATAALFNQTVDSAGRPIGACANPSHNNESTCFVDLFDCAAHAGTSFPLPPTRYITWVAITDDAVANTYAEGVPAYVDITNVDLTYNAQILDDGGYFYLTWDLRAASNNAPLSCGQAGADGVDLTGTVSGGSEAKTDIWNCTDVSGYTAGYRAASYTVSIAALNASDISIGTAPSLTNKSIGRQNAITDLGVVQIPITGF